MRNKKQESEILNGFTKLGIATVNLSGLSIGKQQEILDIFQLIARDFPCIIGRIHSVNLKFFSWADRDAEAETVFYYHTNEIEINLNAFFFLSPFFNRRLIAEKTTGWSAGTGMKGVVAHEAGHVLHYILDMKLYGSNLCELETHINAKTEENAIINCVKMQLGVVSSRINAILSKYGATNSLEGIAESVSEYYTAENPRIFACMVVAILQNKLK